ncbi:endonuclease domain-containing protein [Streptomyces sp. NPDC056534]|uniref:endonuclease domain-containing protein n=1 Tax=Streptomyces sp. NPDC056534 TaxID=3345857 RepID=UPI0036D0F2CB
MATMKSDGGRWGVPEAAVRRAAAELNAVEVDRRDLVRIGPFRGVLKRERMEGALLGWRERIARELQEPGSPDRASRREGSRLLHLAGLDWRRILVEQAQGREARSWWLPRAVVRLLDAAEHAERQWLQGVRQPSEALTADGGQATSPDCPTATLRAYSGELKGQLYTAASRKTGISGKVAEWICAVCRTAPAAVLDHCHEHGYVRAPVCHSCNTLERPDHLYRNTIRVVGRYTRLFDTDTADWLRHWHRCPGCRARTTLPLPHLAAWTAHIACRSLRPTHRRGSRGRTPCGVLRVSWTGSHNTPRSCLLTVAVDCCPSGEHRLLARVPTAKPSSGSAPGWPRPPPTWLPQPDPTAWTTCPPSPGRSSPTPAVKAWRFSERPSGDLGSRPDRTRPAGATAHDPSPGHGE